MTTIIGPQRAAAAPDHLPSLAGELIARDGWSRERLLAHRSERIRETLAHAVTASPYYREALGPDAGAAGVELADLPTLPKATLMDQFDRIVTDRRLRRAALEDHIAGPGPGVRFAGEYRVFSTSGTTGLRGIFVYSAEEWTAWLAAHLRLLRRLGVSPETRVAAIGAPSPLHLSRQLFAALTAGRGGSPPLSVTTPTAEIVETLDAYRPEAVLTYASVAKLLADEQLAGRLHIEPRVVATGAEVLTEDAARRIAEAWGAEPVDIYATTEAPIVAAGTPGERDLLVSDDLVVIEAVDETNRPVPPGQPGYKLLLTALLNRTLPLVRYELSDSVTLAPEPDRSSLPYGRIARVDGRSDDILSLPAKAGGKVDVHPFRLRAPFTRLPEVRRYQVVRKPERLLVRAVLQGSASPESPRRIEEALVAELDRAGALPPPITVEVVDELEREGGHAAKFKLIKSEP